MEAQIFKALGDRFRLKVIMRLSDGSIHTVGSLTKNLGISRQGARKQIQVLVSAKIIKLKPSGREVVVMLNAKSLKKVADFIAHLEMEWDNRLIKLKETIEERLD
jgi:DNA-binding transcriptional ArsR family regulator